MTKLSEKSQDVTHHRIKSDSLGLFILCYSQPWMCLCKFPANLSFSSSTEWQIPAVRCLSPAGLSFLQTAGLWFPFSSSAYSQTSRPLNLGRSLAAPCPNWKLWGGKHLLVKGRTLNTFLNSDKTNRTVLTEQRLNVGLNLMHEGNKETCGAE